jgi:phytoene dehydrogenase-like protein
MRFLGNTMIRDDYDVVVVGAGIGGLTAAALLAKRGLSTLVVEHHYLPGGCCTAIRRQGFTFDVGPELLYGFEETGYNPHRFVMNEIEEEIDMIPHDYVYRMRFADWTITFWRDMDRFLAELCARFPHEESGIRALFAEMSTVYDAVMGGDLVAVVPPSEAPKGHLGINPDADPEALALVGELMERDSRWMIDRYVSDEELIHFFDIVAATFTSCDLAETPAIITAIMFIDNHAGGSCYAADTPQMLSNLLEKAIEKHGGQLLYGHTVDEIVIRDGAARGVRLVDGVEINAGAVVSNATVWNLYGGLVDEAHIDPARMEWAHTFEPTFSFVVAYLGLDASVIPDDFGHVEMIVLDATGFEGEGNFNVELPSLEDPARCPPGTHAMTVVSPNRRRWPRPWDPDYREEDYQAMKQAETEDLLDRMERVLPGIRSAIKVIEIGTPTTVERYTLRNWGNLGGPKPSLGRHMLQRPRARSDWDKLYLCGDSTVMGEGVVASTSSGIGAANMVLRDLELEEYIPHHFDRSFVRYTDGKPWTPPPADSVPLDADVARRLAHECQLCEDAPCVTACPASIDIPGFLRRIEAGNLAGAAAVIRESNPLSEVCGAVCPAERYCQSVCTRATFDDGPVRIADLHGWVCREVPGAEGWGDRAAPSGRRVAVVGAGPAGLSAAHFLSRAGHQVEVFDRAERPGGMLVDAIPGFRLDDTIVAREVEGLSRRGVTFQLGVDVGVDVTLDELDADFDAVFVAVGLSESRPLGLGGERAEPGPPRHDALGFLQAARAGAPPLREGKAVVIGGGSVASDAALTALANGCSSVDVVCIEEEHDMPALVSEIAELRSAGVEIHNGWAPQQWEAQGVRFARCGAGNGSGGNGRGGDGREEMIVAADAVLVAIGQQPGAGFATEVLEADTTSVFLGGDLVRAGGTIVEAVADGRRAAQAIDAALCGR